MFGFFSICVCFLLLGGLVSNMGNTIRLPLPQKLRSHRDIRQGMREGRLGSRKPGNFYIMQIIIIIIVIETFDNVLWPIRTYSAFLEMSKFRIFW